MGNTRRRLESISLQCLVCGFLSVLEESLGTGWDFQVFGVGGKVAAHQSKSNLAHWGPSYLESFRTRSFQLLPLSCTAMKESL